MLKFIVAVIIFVVTGKFCAAIAHLGLCVFYLHFFSFAANLLLLCKDTAVSPDWWSSTYSSAVSWWYTRSLCCFAFTSFRCICFCSHLLLVRYSIEFVVFMLSSFSCNYNNIIIQTYNIYITDDSKVCAIFYFRLYDQSSSVTGAFVTTLCPIKTCQNSFGNIFYES